jgi:hypothetical protein
MKDGNGVIMKNLEPVKLSEFRNTNKQSIELLENTIKSVGGNIVDFSDHQCWKDICELLVPSGITIMRESNHYSKEYGTYWASAVDFLT